jgi:hypothetical protein
MNCHSVSFVAIDIHSRIMGSQYKDILGQWMSRSPPFGTYKRTNILARLFSPDLLMAHPNPTNYGRLVGFAYHDI